MAKRWQGCCHEARGHCQGILNLQDLEVQGIELADWLGVILPPGLCGCVLRQHLAVGMPPHLCVCKCVRRHMQRTRVLCLNRCMLLRQWAWSCKLRTLLSSSL